MRSYEAMPTPPLDWRKASPCQGGECIEVAAQNGAVIMRNSTQPDSTHFYSTTEEFRSFLMGAKAGEFDDLARLVTP
jgi:hypothetical protein